MSEKESARKRLTQDESEERFRRLYRSVHAGVIVQSADGTITHANEIAAEIFGMPVGEIEERTSEDPEWNMILEDGTPVPGDEHPSMITLRTGRPLRNAVRGLFAGRPATVRWLLINTEPLEDEAGEIREVIITFQDITQVKRTAQALEAGEGRLRATLDATTDAAFLMEPNGTIIDCNEGLARRFERRREDIVGSSVYALLPPQVVESRRGHAREVLRTGKPVRFLDERNGLVLENSIYPVFDASNGVVAMAVYARDVTEQRNAERRLRLESERARLYFDMAGVIMVVIRADQTVERINRKGCEILGYPPEETVGRSWFDTFLPEDDRERVREGFRRLIAGDVAPIEYFENPVLTRSGEIRQIAWHNGVIRDDSGRITATVSSGEDVTERLRSEAALRESERALEVSNRIKTIFLTSASDRVYADVLECILDVTESRFGYVGIINGNGDLVCPSMTREVWSQCQVPEKSIVFPRERWGGLWGRSLEEKRSLYQNGQLRLPAGHIELESALVVPILYRDRLIGQIAVADRPQGYGERQLRLVESIAEQTAPVLDARLRQERDEARRRRAEQELTRLSTAIEQSAETVIITDTDTTVLYVNRAAEQATGYTREELVGRPVSVLDGGPTPPERVREVRDMVLAGRTWSGELMNRRRDGSTYRVLASIAPVRDESGRVSSVVSVQRDVTRERELEAQLRQSQKMDSIGRLAGGVAHDFNNLLTVIIGHSDMVIQSLSPGGDLHESVSEILAAARRAEQLTRQLLAFSRRQVVELRVIGLNELIRGMDKMLRRLIGEHIDLAVVAREELWPVYVDPGQLEQVVTNLVINARDAMPGGGRITLKAANAVMDEQAAVLHPEIGPGEYVRMSVSDTGCGMDEETRTKSVEPFFTTKGRGKGTGLGLSTSYGIVRQAGGSLSIASRPGEGTTVTFYLPRAEAVAARASGEPAPEAAPHGTETVLVAEDDPNVRRTLTRILESGGYRVLEAANGEEALRVARGFQGVIDLLMTDVIMPRMGGKELSERLRERFPRARTLFVSGYTDDSVMRQGALEPGLVLLHKPFTPREVLRKVRDVLDG